MESEFEKKLEENENNKSQETMPPGRNSPCPCNSGKKYTECCGTLTWIRRVSYSDLANSKMPLGANAFRIYKVKGFTKPQQPKAQAQPG